MSENTFMSFQKRAQESGLSSAVSQPCSGARSSDFSGLEGNSLLKLMEEYIYYHKEITDTDALNSWSQEQDIQFPLMA